MPSGLVFCEKYFPTSHLHYMSQYINHTSDTPRWHMESGVYVCGYIVWWSVSQSVSCLRLAYTHVNIINMYATSEHHEQSRAVVLNIFWGHAPSNHVVIYNSYHLKSGRSLKCQNLGLN